MEYFFNRIFYCMCYSWRPWLRLLLKIDGNSRERLIEKKVIRVKPNGELDFSRFAMLNIVNVPATFGLMCMIFCMVTIPIGFFCSHKLLLPKLIAESISLLIVFLPIIVLDCLIYR